MTGSHKTVGRVGSICVLDGPVEWVLVHVDVRECHAARLTRRAAHGDTSGGGARHMTRGTHQPFAATAPRDPSLGMSPNNGSAKEPRRVEAPALRLGERHRRPRPDSVTLNRRAKRAPRLEPPALCERRAGAGASTTRPRQRCPTRSRIAPLPGRCAKEPDRRAGVIGIKIPSRSIANVALTDGACRELPALTEKTRNSGAADRECLFVRTGPQRVANDPDARSSHMRSLS